MGTGHGHFCLCRDQYDVLFFSYVAFSPRPLYGIFAPAWRAGHSRERHSGLGLGQTTQSPVGSHEVSGWGAEGSTPAALSPSETAAAGFPTVVLVPAQYAHDGFAVN